MLANILYLPSPQKKSNKFLATPLLVRTQDLMNNLTTQFPPSAERHQGVPGFDVESDESAHHRHRHRGLVSPVTSGGGGGGGIFVRC